MELNSGLLKLLFDKAPVGLALLGLDRTVHSCNSEFRRIYGFDTVSFGETILPIPDHQFDNYQELVANLRRGIPFVGVETVRVRRDGRQFYARISGSPIPNVNGVVDRFVASISVSDANHSEQLELRTLEDLVQGGSDFMCVASLDHTILFLNQSGRVMTGIRPDEEIDDLRLTDLFAPDSQPHFLEVLETVEDAGTSISTTLSLRNRMTEGFVPVSAFIYLVNDPHTGESTSVGCVATRLW